MTLSGESYRALQLQARVTELEGRVLRLQERMGSTTWGSCKRGCPPAYLDKKGFCSPACAMGAPRGEFVTVKETSAA